MKLPAKNLNGNKATRSPVSQTTSGRTIQQRRPGGSTCRTPACCASHSHGQLNGPGHVKQNLNPTRGVAPNPRNQQGAASLLSSRTLNYRVHNPIPLGQGNQQIRATIQGSPQVAGSVEISAAGGGKAYISNLTVDQQHRRRGVAAKLIDAAINTARRQGFRAATLEARPSDNGISPQALVAMYRRQGFKSIGKSQRGSPMMERRL